MSTVSFYVSAKKYLVIIWTLAVVVLAILFELSGIFVLPFWVFAAVPLFAFLGSVIAHLYTKTIRVDLEENELIYSSGILVRKKKTIPYNRIDNTQKIRSLFDYILGLATLEIDTPGKTQVEVLIKNIELKDAQKIEDVLKEKMKGKYYGFQR